MADRDELAEILHRSHCGCIDFQGHTGEDDDPTYHVMADAVLASQWLAVARRDAATTALREAADAVWTDPAAWYLRSTDGEGNNPHSWAADWLRGRASMLASPEEPVNPLDYSDAPDGWPVGATPEKPTP